MDRGTISQNIDMGTSRICSLSFWMAGNPDYSDTKTLDVHFGSNTRYFTFDQTGHTKENMGWEEKTASGLIASGPTQLRFVDTGTDAYGPAIDDISLNVQARPLFPSSPPWPSPLHSSSELSVRSSLSRAPKSINFFSFCSISRDLHNT